MVLNHLKKLLGSRLNSRVGHEHDLHELGHEVRVPDIVLVAQHHDEERHDILSAGLVEHLGRVPGWGRCRRKSSRTQAHAGGRSQDRRPNRGLSSLGGSAHCDLADCILFYFN